jgi:uncharacterized Zn-binding protein involved in type VI secretion
MPGQPAARVGDKIICPLPNPTPPGPPLHTIPTGRPIQGPGCDSVQIGGAAAARITDRSICDGPSKAPVPNPILKGAFPVLVGKMPAARMTDMGAHPGSLIAPPCCPSVMIGLAGTAGNPWEGKEECEKAQAGRSTPGQPHQSYQNCGVESSRQLINRKNNSNVTEDQLLNDAMNRRMPDGRRIASRQYFRRDSGATNSQGIAGLLTAWNVPAFVAPRMLVERAVATGRGVIAGVDVGTSNYYDPRKYRPRPGSYHAVVVTGIEYDDDGNIVKVHTSDTGIRNGCDHQVDGAVFQQALDNSPYDPIVTRETLF